MSFMPTLEKLGEVSAADIFGQNNIIYYSLFKETGSSSRTITEKDMLGGPSVGRAESWIYNNYTYSFISGSMPLKDEKFGILLLKYDKAWRKK